MNYFYSFYLLVTLFEPTDFRALGNFLAVRKKTISIFNNSVEIFSHPVKITWKRNPQSCFRKSYLSSESHFKDFPYVQKKFRSFFKGGGWRDIRLNLPKLHTIKL